MSRIALIDGDILLYRVGFGAEKTHYLTYVEGSAPALYSSHKEIPKDTPKEVIWNRKEVDTEESAVRALEATVKNILRNLGTDKYEIYLSDSTTFRHKIAVTQPYKGNRDGAPKPVHYRPLKSNLLNNLGGSIRNGLEADDCISIRSTELGDSGVIVSIDKDFRQIAGQYYDWVRDEMGEVAPRDAALSLGCQLLSGDPTDNIPGITGIGPAKSRKALAGASSTANMLQIVRKYYLDFCGGDESVADAYLREQGGLVYLLRDWDDSFDKWLEKYEQRS